VASAYDNGASAGLIISTDDDYGLRRVIEYFRDNFLRANVYLEANIADAVVGLVRQE
jgi:hypothetical protein